MLPLAERRRSMTDASVVVVITTAMTMCAGIAIANHEIPFAGLSVKPCNNPRCISLFYRRATQGMIAFDGAPADSLACGGCEQRSTTLSPFPPHQRAQAGSPSTRMNGKARGKRPGERTAGTRCVVVDDE
jgi:hypothetical protein